MRGWVRYLWKAFNARPFGAPIPPFWFMGAAFGLLGVFLDPGFFLIGAGVTAACVALVAGNPRFRNAIDAADLPPAPDQQALLQERLDPQSRQRQAKLEEQCRELQHVLETANAGSDHINGVWQLAQLHLRLLVARSAADAVVSNADGEDHRRLSDHLAELDQRLAQPNLDNDLREALEDQSKVLKERLAMQTEASRRLQVLDAELERIREQIALIREQALLTTDASGISRSVDALSTFLNESSRWLHEQQEIFGELDSDPLMPDPMSQAPLGGTQQKQRAGKRAGELQ
ncbi:MAG TPA: hypothetical protein VLV76_17110 [Candidatus Acidoferrum sp.]|nr:hypothetical protein [Candidatus Acidoferrum sp.]